MRTPTIERLWGFALFDVPSYLYVYVHPLNGLPKATEGHLMTETVAAAPSDTEQYALDRMAADGISPTQEIYIDVWGYHDIKRWYFPGQESVPEQNRLYLKVQKMTEGVRQKYQKATNAKVTILKQNSNAEMGVDPARDREQLILKSVTGWYMRRPGAGGGFHEVEYTDRAFREWFDGANPAHIEDLEKFIRDINPWMLDEVTLEAIDKEIDRLQEQREEVARRQEEKVTFPTSD